MAKITALDVADALTGDEHLPIVQGAATKRVTMAAFRNLITPYLQNWYKGDRGVPGPAGNTYETLGEIAASPTTNLWAALTPQQSSDLAAATYAWQPGDFTGRNDVIASTWLDPDTGAVTPVSKGAWVLPDDRALLSRLKAPGAATITQEAINGERVSVKRFGAKGDGIADDTMKIQLALDWAASIGGGTIEIPTGVYKITSALKLPGNVSLVGHGQFSRIMANSCHGINVLASDVIGPRRIADLWVQGNGGENFAALYADVDFPARIQGLVVENTYFSFFGTAVRAKGLWHTTFRTVCIHQVHTGFLFSGRNVKVTIDDCRVTHGGAIVGDGPSMGLQVGDDSPGFRPEEIHVTKTIFYGFGRAVYWRNCLFGSVMHCGMDYCTEVAIHFVTADGGTTFSHNWGQIDNADAVIWGIRGEALGTTPNIDNIEIANNRLRATTVSSVPGELRSLGIDVANKQANLRIVGNSMQGAFQIGIRVEGAARSHVRENTADGPLLFFSNRGGSLKDNHFEGGMTFSDNVGVKYAGNSGLHTTEINGSIDIPAGQTSVTVTWLSLNQPDLPLGGISIACTGGDRGFVGHTWVSFAPTRTGMTVTVPEPLGALSTIDFNAKVYS